MAAVDRKMLSLSWAESASAGRYCGSRYSTGVTQALIRAELYEMGSQHREIDDKAMTYTSLAKGVHEILEKEVDPWNSSIYPNTVSFSAQDDAWGAEWRQRTGFPLNGFAQKWNALQPIHPGTNTGVAQCGSIKLPQAIYVDFVQGNKLVRLQAKMYMESFPGPDNAAKNHRVHSYCKRLIRREPMTQEELCDLALMLRYRRLSVINRATLFKNYLKLEFHDCHRFDVYKHIATNYKDQTVDRRWGLARDLVIKSHIFDRPGSGEGLEYDKGIDYLAIALTHTSMTLEDAEAAIAALIPFKQEYGPMDVTWRQMNLMRHKSVRSDVDTLTKRKRSPSKSPTKHKRKPIPEEWLSPGKGPGKG